MHKEVTLPISEKENCNGGKLYILYFFTYLRAMTSSCTTFQKILAKMLNSFLSVLLSCTKTIQEKGFGVHAPLNFRVVLICWGPATMKAELMQEWQQSCRGACEEMSALSHNLQPGQLPSKLLSAKILDYFLILILEVICLVIFIQKGKYCSIIILN